MSTTIGAPACSAPTRGRVWRRRPRPVAGALAALAVIGITAGSPGSSSTSDVPPDARDAAIGTTLHLSMTVSPGDPVPLSLLRERAADEYEWSGRPAGQGVDVAIIDSGVSPVTGLDQPGKLVHGPDLSDEGGDPNLAHLDTYGHGTHLAGIIAGDDGDQVLGIAPGSRLVSVKVAGASGATDLTQVIAAIDWVIEHRTDNGLNIRVLNLSLGLPGVTSNVGDPLSAAVERAWKAGIVVVAAAGNRGNDSGGVDSPAVSPYVIAVGATEQFDSRGRTDAVAPFSSGGDGVRNPDVLAPGRSVLSLRAPGSSLDRAHPEARVGERYFRGSGTSQSAAVVSGYAAALLSLEPELTPDEVKWLHARSATDLLDGSTVDGSGKIDPRRVARRTDTAWRAPQQAHAHAWDGVDANGVALVEPTGSSWSGGEWTGASWAGGTWSGASWAGASWAGASWAAGEWSGASWAGASWAGASWAGASWAGASWAGASW